MVFWLVPLQTHSLLCLRWFTSPAISLLCHLFHELLGHGPPILNLHRLCWYAPSYFTIRMTTQSTNLTDTVMGIANIYMRSTSTINEAAVTDVTTSYHSICLSIRLLLTLMIIARLIPHRRNLRRTIGTPDGAMEPYTTVITMLVESCALYVATLLFYIIPVALGSWVAVIPAKILGQVQVRAALALFNVPRAWNGFV